jgi:GH15 family glucan-1,4-alpha-glucosidase
VAGLIEDYAMIGDMRTAALVCRNGSIDWLCWPRFDSASCFAALLGTPEHGRWLIAPKSEAKIRRRYRDGTMILETTFATKEGKLSLVDFMPVGAEHSSIVRLVIGREGAVPMRTDLVVRFDYGIAVPWVSRTDETTLSMVAGPNMLTLHTPAPLKGKDLRTTGEFTIRAGEIMPFVLSYTRSHLPPPLPLSVETSLAQTEEFWREWSGRCALAGPAAPKIRRSLLTLKALSYRATGGIVAAVTTSLPEQLGGSRNWDYRYCWLRDATFTLLAFLNAGYTDEATAWQNWLMRAIAGSPDQFQTLYGVGGERRLDEWQIPWLPGYEQSVPVRVGNAAVGQFQLDIYGELADVMTQSRKGGLAAAPRRKEIRAAFLEHLADIWRNPDEGIWEIRGAPQHFTHSKVMAWVAFDRAWRNAHERGENRARKKWKKIADEIHADICRQGIDRERGCFVQAYGSKHLDASLLLLAIVGFLPPKDPRIRRTIREIERHLLVDGFVLRYETGPGVDGLPPGEAAFLACSFWLVDNYILQGRKADATRLFNKLIKLTNDVGLLAEEYDPRAKRMLGNFPQAFSHVALVNSALNLMDAAHRRPLVQLRGKKAARPHVARDKRLNKSPIPRRRSEKPGKSCVADGTGGK